MFELHLSSDNKDYEIMVGTKVQVILDGNIWTGVITGFNDPTKTKLLYNVNVTIAIPNETFNRSLSVAPDEIVNIIRGE